MVASRSGLPVAVDGDTYGFEVTRARFTLSGNVVSPEWFYKLEIETAANNSASVAGGAGFKADFRAGNEPGWCRSPHTVSSTH